MASRAWPPEWLRGTLELCVLGLVSEGPAYGYAIARRLEDVGLGTIKGGTLYPLLNRLEAEGYFTVDWHAGKGAPSRKFYELTDSGRRQLGLRAAAWEEFIEVVGHCVNAKVKSEAQ